MPASERGARCQYARCGEGAAGGMTSEHEQLLHYLDDTLRVPQVAADTILGSIFLADAGNRAPMAAAIAREDHRIDRSKTTFTICICAVPLRMWAHR